MVGDQKKVIEGGLFAAFPPLRARRTLPCAGTRRCSSTFSHTHSTPPSSPRCCQRWERAERRGRRWEHVEQPPPTVGMQEDGLGTMRACGLGLGARCYHPRCALHVRASTLVGAELVGERGGGAFLRLSTRMPCACTPSPRAALHPIPIPISLPFPLVSSFPALIVTVAHSHARRAAKSTHAMCVRPSPPHPFPALLTLVPRLRIATTHRGPSSRLQTAPTRTRRWRSTCSCA
ncbi:hypothetical protein B0H16DRAFT_1509179 [Mycena metata]|uniref:Uncharacterized protein n=1 Tax=Mycena metata TaxID=1033252 RepID=A0AAD7NTT5_9AGAR|nr:hypothetical protein B0H16DRAFT_1509179 [Mycena metata]